MKGINKGNKHGVQYNENQIIGTWILVARRKYNWHCRCVVCNHTILRNPGGLYELKCHSCARAKKRLIDSEPVAKIEAPENCYIVIMRRREKGVIKKRTKILDASNLEKFVTIKAKNYEDIEIFESRRLSWELKLVINEPNCLEVHNEQDRTLAPMPS